MNLSTDSYSYYTYVWFYLIYLYLLLQQKISFWFATGGAGFCLSRALASKMIPVAR